MRSKRERPERGGHDWSEDEEQMLRDNFFLRVPLEKLAEMHQRTRGGILGRLSKMGLVDYDGAGKYFSRIDGTEFALSRERYDVSDAIQKE